MTEPLIRLTVNFDVQTEATNSSLFSTVLHFNKYLTQQTTFTMTNILNARYIASCMYITMTGIPLPPIVFHIILVRMSHEGETQQCKNVR